MEVYDGTLFDEFLGSLSFIGLGTIKHVLENLGVGTQDAAMNAKVFSLDCKDDVTVIDPWIEAIWFSSQLIMSYGGFFLCFAHSRR